MGTYEQPIANRAVSVPIQQEAPACDAATKAWLAASVGKHLHELRIQLRKEYADEIDNLKKEISNLRREIVAQNNEAIGAVRHRWRR
jgi:hypothetical protein